MNTIRLVFMLLAGLLGAFIGFAESEPESGLRATATAGGAAVGIIASFLIILVESKVRRANIKSILGATIGVATGLCMANLFAIPIYVLPLESNAVAIGIPVLLNLVFGYLGMTISMRKFMELDFSEIRAHFKGTGEMGDSAKILDTSVIIDGRISEIAESGFLDGTLIVPKFVLGELQLISDSSDPMKRTRGRRGLDILQKMQKNHDLKIKIIDDDFPKIREVDSKLIALCKQNGGKIVTNDYNLNKVAELQGVSVLNINQLALAVKQAVIPGEEMRVLIAKEGKEYNQGVGYLEDGTMIVVDNGRKHIGQNMEVVVTSVLQTTAGRMIFTRLKDDSSIGQTPAPGQPDQRKTQFQGTQK